MTSDRLSVAIDCRVTPASAGGVAQVILGLVHALGRLDDTSTHYKIVVESQLEQDFLRPYLGTTQQFVIKTPTFARRVQRRVASSGKALTRRLFGDNVKDETPVPSSDSFFETLGCDVVHFPHQRFVLCSLPTIYNPHDLQHLHFPEFFKPSELPRRDNVYRTGCQLAHTVAVSSRWVKEDVVSQYQVDPDKVQVIPWAPPTEAYKEPGSADVEEVRRKFKLDGSFVLYPAMTWPHKNHLRLLEALALLRDKREMKLRLVCTGSLLEPHAATIKQRVDELNLTSQVNFLGFVSDTELRAIYKLAQFLVMPSLFESDSSPIYEAWLEGTPIACSNVTSLPVQVMDAAILFDPNDAAAIADAMASIATDSGLRRTLSELGYLRVKDYDWEKTAKAYRAVYRRAGRHTLSDEDRWLLDWDWMERPMRLQGAGV